jgi:hypothetical protein
MRFAGWGLLAVMVATAACGEIVGLGPERVLTDPAVGGAGGQGGGESDDGLIQCDDPFVWVRSFGDIAQQYVWRVAADGHGGAYFAGQFRGSMTLGDDELVSRGERDLFVGRIDGDGEVLWARSFGTEDDDEPSARMVNHPDGVIVVGHNKSSIDLGDGPHASIGADADAFVALFSEDGEHRWTSWIGGFGQQGWVDGVVLPSSGDFVAAGYFTNSVMVGEDFHSAVGGDDILVTRFRGTDGEPIASRAFGSVAQDFVKTVAVTADERMVVAGHVGGPIDFGFGASATTDSDGWVALLSSSLEPAWAKVFVAEEKQQVRAAAVAPDGSIVLHGILYGEVDFGTGVVGPGTADGFVARLSSVDGSGIYSEAIGAFSLTSGISIDEAGDIVWGGAYDEWVTLGGQMFAPVHDRDALLVKFSSTFDVKWVELGTSSSFDDVYSNVVFDDASNLIVGGRFGGVLDLDGCEPVESAGDTDAFIAKRRP